MVGTTTWLAGRESAWTALSLLNVKRCHREARRKSALRITVTKYHLFCVSFQPPFPLPHLKMTLSMAGVRGKGRGRRGGEQLPDPQPFLQCARSSGKDPFTPLSHAPHTRTHTHTQRFCVWVGGEGSHRTSGITPRFCSPTHSPLFRRRESLAHTGTIHHITFCSGRQKARDEGGAGEGMRGKGGD